MTNKSELAERISLAWRILRGKDTPLVRHVRLDKQGKLCTSYIPVPPEN